MINYNFDENNVVQEVAKIVSNIAGIQLGEKQFPMVESRLKSRMLKLAMDTYQEYLAYLKENKEHETEALVSLLTTHHTFFFREFAQFEYILNRKLKDIISEADKRKDKKIRVWSAACSGGHEVYSLAMFLDFHLKHLAPHLDFEIWGTDIDVESVATAKNGVYRTSELNKSPAMYLGSHWIQGKDNVRDFSKVKNSLKSKCHFTTLNLLNADEFKVNNKFDLIFCRNVFIYFNSEQIESISSKLIDKLTPQGAFIIGVSESLYGLNLPIESVGPSVYKVNNIARKVKEPVPVPVEISKPVEKTLNILCVDDSSTIHALLKNVLNAEHGFNIKHKAMNGEEALKLLETEKYDAITLDLHMPIIDGLEFLARRKDKTPVIIVSAISRDDDSIARKALALGALDYVEKPTRENLVNSGNEIRSKIKSVIKLSKAANEASPSSATAEPVSVSTVKPAAAAVVRPVASVVAAKPSAVTNINQEKKIRTLIVDDSESIRVLLKKVLAQDPAFEIIGTAKDAFEAEKMIQDMKPDLITMDIHMPKKSGIQLLKEIQQRHFIPTVMISALAEEDGPYIMEAMAEGAIDYIKKPDLKNLLNHAHEIHEKLKIAAKAKKNKKTAIARKVIDTGADLNKDHVVLIGSSTGGVEAIRSVLEQLPNEIPPILIVQHMPAFFTKSFADRLNTLVSFEVKEAEENDEIVPNRVLIAPGGKQMGIKIKGDKKFVHLSQEAFDSRHSPSVDYLFKSAFDAKIKNATAVILTGMGNDGTREVKKLKTLGVNTIAQDEATCVVYGMPRAAYESGAIDFVVPLPEVAEKIILLSKKKSSQKAS